MLHNSITHTKLCLQVSVQPIITSTNNNYNILESYVKVQMLILFAFLNSHLEESGVWTSSTTTIRPSGALPISYLVSTSIKPPFAACYCP